MEEQVKFYYFKIPMSTFKVTLTIEGLTEDFYPIAYLYKNLLTSAPTDFTTLAYPHPANNTWKLGNKFVD